MSVLKRIEARSDELAQIRRDIHAHPETAFEEERTSDLVADYLTRHGIEFERGFATTGIVATIRAGEGARRIGLRADLDALHIHEKNDFAHRSRHDGKMHACGHDGHTAMLLGAARDLKENPDFDGTVHLIFQPAEEGLGGARVMVEEGFLERYPMDAIYGMHNMPGWEAGHFAMRSGPMMAASDSWTVTLHGKGGHGAMPHKGTDATVAAAQFILALQTVVSRALDPIQTAVISVGHMAAGDFGAPNVIPSDVLVRGTARSFRPEVRDLLEARIAELAESAARLAGCTATCDYERRYPPVINHEAQTRIAARAAAEVVGSEAVHLGVDPISGSEDFSYFLNEVPGAYVLIGNGPVGEGGFVHAPLYDFNDEIIARGAAFWVELVGHELGTNRD